MGLNRVIGQDSAKNSLRKFEGLQSSIVIEGPRGSGKGFLAQEFGKELTSEDYVRVFKSGQRASVADAREVVRWVQVQSLTGQPKVVVIEDANLQPESIMNICLKAVEEGFGRWIFTVVDSKILLDTIVSRCFRVRTGFFTEEELFRIAKSWRYLNSDSELAAKKARGSVRNLYAFLEGELSDVEELAESLLDSVSRRRIGRLFRDLTKFRGEKSRVEAQLILEYVLNEAVQSKWPSEELLKVVKASERMKVGESPYLVMSNLFISLKVKK